MDPKTGIWERAVAALAGEPGADRIAGPDSRLFVWSLDGDRLLWRSHRAAQHPLWTGQDVLAPADRQRLRALGRGLASRRAFRLERWRLRGNRLGLPLTLACRIVEAEGQEALLTAVLEGPSSQGGPDPVPEATAAAEISTQSVEPAPLAPEPEPAPELPRGRSRSRRFVWLMDEEGRFLEVSPGLAESVGPTAGRIEGRLWRRLTGPIVIDEHESIARHLADRTGWTRSPVLWRDVEQDRVLVAELSGAPVLTAQGEVTGFRGFGLAYPDEATPMVAGLFSDLATLDEDEEEPSPAQDTAPAEDSVAPLEAGPVAAEPTRHQLTGLDQALNAAAALTGSAGETVFGVLRALFNPPFGAAHADSPSGKAERDTPPAAAEPPDVAPEPPPSGGQSPAGPGGLSPDESGALHEIARALGSIGETDEPASPPRPTAEIVALPTRPRPLEAARILDRLPVAAMVLRDETPIFANRPLLALAGHDDLPAWVAHGGVTALLGRQLDGLPDDGSPTLVTLAGSGPGIARVEAHRAEIVWGDAPATLLCLLAIPESGADQPRETLRLERDAARHRAGELQASLEFAADGLLTLDPAGRILSVNGAAERLFGYAANEIVGEVVTTLITPEDHRTALACLERVAGGDSGPAGREFEARGRLRDGIARPLSVRAGMVAGSDGPIYVLAFHDLSRFKQVEDELREARGVAERAGANRADFLARISHEIRTPLTAITGFAELMLEERFGPLGSERYRGYMRDIYASGGHVVSLVNDLLDLAKASSGQIDLEPENLDLNEIVQQCVALSAPLAGRERTILRTSFDPALPPVRADERAVRQIVLNVLSNAIRFTGAGGQVIVSTASAGPGDVRLSVRDTGPGMSEVEIEAALTPFRQVAATRRTDGTGLGLPLSKALVEANGGVFSITSGRDRGTLIAVHLPAAPAQAVAAE
ncbi:ATP-binding protein [uncultured Enterovirga sp.]|uniref:ATP-binding protein n=1 Tax=uncultured Enterovirga sp. TaxID=2026352 RepID=UPI0035CC1B0D